MGHLIVDAVLRYPAEVRDPGQRKPRRAVREESVPMRVAAVEEGEAPVIARIATQDMVWARDPSVARHPMIPLRQYMGGTFAPIGSRHASRDHQALNPRNAMPGTAPPLPWEVQPRPRAEIAAALVSQGGPLNTGSRVYESTRLVRDADVENLRDIEAPEREGALAALNVQASSLIVVDGLIWERVAEPCWLMAHDGEGVAAQLRWSDEKSVTDAPVQSFRLDRLQDALATGPDWGPPEHAQVRGEAECLAPSALRFDPVPESLVFAAARAVRSWRMSDFLEAGEGESLAWIRLRDALLPLAPGIIREHSDRDVSSRPIGTRAGEVVALAGALQAYADERTLANQARHVQGGPPPTVYEVGVARRALRRWVDEHPDLASEGPEIDRDNPVSGRPGR